MESTSSYEAQLPAELSSVVAARRLVDSAVASWGVGEKLTQDAALVVSELVTNAVLHSGTVLSVRVSRLDPGVRLEVEDGSTQPPVVVTGRPEDMLATSSMTGRGLALLAGTADRWGSDPLPDGKAVWAELGTGWRGSAAAASPVRSSAAAEFAKPSGGGAGRMVHMIAVPVRLLIESVRQFADLQREMQVVGLDHSGPKELVALAEANREISAHIGGLRQAGSDVAEAAVARGESIVDFHVEVADEAVEAFDRLRSLMRQMTGTLGQRHLLSMPPSDDVVAYRTWYRDEINSQLEGRAPRRCPFSPAPA